MPRKLVDPIKELLISEINKRKQDLERAEKTLEVYTSGDSGTQSGRRHLSAAAKKRISISMKERWARKNTDKKNKYGPGRPHWTQTPAGRAKNRKNLLLMTKARRKLKLA